MKYGQSETAPRQIVFSRITDSSFRSLPGSRRHLQCSLSVNATTNGFCVLIRQQRIKKGSDSSSSGQQYGSDLDTLDVTNMYPQNLLTIPAHHHFERQISEPIIPTSPAVSSPPEARSAPADRSHGGHRLTVSQQPYLARTCETTLPPIVAKAFQAISSYPPHKAQLR
ncbi:uncharacterized protein LOC134227353 [Armigeres subalbatus]|uniref:uncharacterized protein LOC134227353 n=1 Tax=Armigeres subalbatus TaxID=124917 RepID=UPI002ED1960B